MLVWTFAGIALALLWVSRAADAFFGMRRIPDISTPEWNSHVNGMNTFRLKTDDRQPAATVSIIVPARDEQEHVEAAVRSLLALDYPACEIIAVNDRSADATGEILNRLAAEWPQRLRVIHIERLPERWLGKTHAMWTAAQQASGDWLLFTDADVVFRGDALQRAVAYAEASGADHLVLVPELQMQTAGERMMLAFFQILFVFGHRLWKVADPHSRDHLGVGAFNLIRRCVYERVGSYKALRLSVLDDMKLGELVKTSGFRQRCVFGAGLVSVRWAHGAFGVVQNLTKNFFALMQYKLWKALGFTLLLVGFNLAPFVAFVLAPGLAKIGYGVALLAIACLYLGMSWHSQVTPQYFFLHPVSTALFVYTMLRSITLTLLYRGVVWRGTKYPLDELRKVTSSK